MGGASSASASTGNLGNLEHSHNERSVALNNPKLQHVTLQSIKWMSVLLLRSWQRVNAFVFHSNSPFSFISMHLLNCPSLISRPNCCSSPSALPWHLSRPPFSNICLGMFGESWRLLQNKYKRDLAPYLPTRFPKSTNKLKSSPAKALLTKTPAASSRRSRIWKNSNEKQNQTRKIKIKQGIKKVVSSTTMQCIERA